MPWGYDVTAGSEGTGLRAVSHPQQECGCCQALIVDTVKNHYLRTSYLHSVFPGKRFF